MGPEVAAVIFCDASRVKDYDGQSLVQTSSAELPNINASHYVRRILVQLSKCEKPESGPLRPWCCLGFGPGAKRRLGRTGIRVKRDHTKTRMITKVRQILDQQRHTLAAYGQHLLYFFFFFFSAFSLVFFFFSFLFLPLSKYPRT